ncbi:MAG TPA: glycoside-pentoside-hexuronide (GPH):cation symporter [Atopostipes sp.]|nr:glycoside-pentoside-hexuronide (GPH):cation symporter [Atopostipes sp.]
MASNESVTTNQSPVEQNKPPFGIKDKIGYMSGDLANNLTFQFASLFLMVFYTEVWGVNPAVVGTLFAVSRIVDAFTDVSMGVLVDKVPAREDGKFRPWIKWVMGPIAIASFLMYQTGLSDASMTVKIVYMYVTYILWGSFTYTAINIPYGSMASALTPNPNERTELSIWRTRGQVLGQMFVGVLTPLLIYTDGNAVKQDSTFTWVAGIFSILTLVFYWMTYSFTTERVKIDEVEQTDEESGISGFFKKMGSLISQKSLLSITGSSIFLLMTLILMSSMYNYLFPHYYNYSDAISIISFLNPIIVFVIVSPIASKFGQQYGKKETATAGLLLGALVYFAIYFIEPQNVWVYIALSSIAYAGLSIFNALVWAMITDVIDDIEVKTKSRDDGTVYAINSFARKIGQALAGLVAGYALAYTGYQTATGGEVVTQTAETISGIFTISTLGPAVGFLITALFVWFVYPLNKNITLENQQILEKRKGSSVE